MQKMHKSDGHVSCHYITAAVLAALRAPFPVHICTNAVNAFLEVTQHVYYMNKKGAWLGLALRYGFSRFTPLVTQGTPRTFSARIPS
jgi:hypothetical protein